MTSISDLWTRFLSDPTAVADLVKGTKRAEELSDSSKSNPHEQAPLNVAVDTGDGNQVLVDGKVAPQLKDHTVAVAEDRSPAAIEAAALTAATLATKRG
jgi:hypothetical protein